jgi:sugar diacid utilization regulator
MTPTEKAIILAYARNDMNVLKTSRDMTYHRGTVEYHLERIKEKYGLNPKKFYDLVKLTKMAKGGE